MTNPLISIIVPSYNQAQFLGESLQSVLEQTYENWECIIINDGSTDNTEEISSLWVAKDLRFKYYCKENGGVSSARNLGISMSKGTYILPLDADDVIGNDYIRLAINEFQIDNSLVLVYSNATFFGEVNEFWNLPNFEFKNFLLDNCIYCSAVFKRIDFLKIAGYDENLKYGYEDWELWINLLSQYQNPKVKKIDYLGFFYRRKLTSRDVEFLRDEAKKVETKFEIYKKHHHLYDSYFGSYIDNLRDLSKKQKDIDKLLTSKKFVINLFTKKFFGIKFFITKDIKIFK